MSNYIGYQVWDETACPFWNFNDWSNFVPHFTGYVIIYYTRNPALFCEKNGRIGWLLLHYVLVRIGAQG